MVHLANSAKNELEKKANYYEIYGCDFLLDQDLQIWFMECQSDPGFNKKCSPKLLQGAWEITYGLLRSRIRRMIAYVNQLTVELKGKNIEDKAFLREFLKDKQAAYDKINRNSFEPEFRPTKKNNWVKIIDETAKGVKRYGGLFPSECTSVLSK